MKPRLALAAAALCASVSLLPHAAHAAPGLLIGVDDDSLKWYGHTASLLSIYRTLGVGAVRVTLDWTPGESFPSGTDRVELQRAANAGRSIRVVLAVTGSTTQPPLDAGTRAGYCGFIANVLRRYSWIHDVAIWTEPNSGRFWQPHENAAAAYENLLATCWDVLHAAQPAANVIATSAPHANPGRWYEDLGKAYRASGRALPVFDTVGHNAYPETSAEPPGVQHGKSSHSIDQGDLNRLLAAIRKGFGGTAQPLPGDGRVTVWYLEDGFQTIPGRSIYYGTETGKHPVSEDEQAAQLSAAVQLAYCQPAVGAFFNFELRDDAALDGWQSGLVRPDWSPKPAFAAFQQALQAAAARTVQCGTIPHRG